MLKRNRNIYKGMSDVELIVQFKQNNDQKIIGVIYEKYAHLIYGTCLKYLRNQTEAEDITMQIFEDLGEKLNKHNVSFLKSWLYIVTKNSCFMFLRKRKLKIDVELLPEINENDESDNDKVKLENQLVLMEDILKELKPIQAECLKLFYLDGKSYEEIEKTLLLSNMQVKSAIQNGKRNLKIKMEESIYLDDSNI